MTDEPPETCDVCVFDGARWTTQDAVRTVAQGGDLVAYATEHLPPDLWRAEPPGGSGSIADIVARIRADFTSAAGDSVPAPDRTATGVDLVAGLQSSSRRASKRLGPLAGEQAPGVPGARRPAHRVELVRLCHVLIHGLHGIAMARHDLGDTVGPMKGTVRSLQASNGGVPKTSVIEAVVDAGGFTCDRQATRRHHGRPTQALCLYSSDVIERLQAEGHPIEAGNVGENITVAGIDWSRLRAGLVVEVGEVRCRLSAPAAPCAQNHQWFSGTSSMRISHERHPGWSRWYASVLAGGTLHPGDGLMVTSQGRV